MYIQFLDAKSTENALRTLPPWFLSKKVVASVNPTDITLDAAPHLPTESPLSKAVVYLKNIPSRVTKRDLGQFIAEGGISYLDASFGCITRNSINSYGEVTLPNLGEALKCLQELNGKMLVGTPVKMELSSLLLDHVDNVNGVSSAVVNTTSGDLEVDSGLPNNSSIVVPKVESSFSSAWLASNRTILIHRFPDVDPESVLDQVQMALGVNTLTNLNISRVDANGRFYSFACMCHSNLYDVLFSVHSVSANKRG